MNAQLPKGIQILPLGKTFGAEVRGVDLSAPLDADAFADIYQAFLRYQVLVFPDQHISEEDQIAFSRRFGRLQVNVRSKYHHQRHPEIYLISNIDEQGLPKPEHPDPAATVWHTDGSYEPERPIATMLYGMMTPRMGGDTVYADMYAAYEALPPAQKAQLETMRAVHSLEDSLRRSDPRQIVVDEVAKAPPVDHPIVRIHPDTGRRCLYLGQHASYALGMPRAEGEALVDALNTHATQPAFQYRHRWFPNDVVVWDNRCLLHQATAFDFARERRMVRRTTMIGEWPPHLGA